MHNREKAAKRAGLLYLIYIVVHVLTDVLGRASIIVYGDAATSAQNIMDSLWLFRIGYVGDLVAALLFFLAAWALYTLLKPVNKDLALLFLLLNAIGVSIQCVSDLFLVGSDVLLSGADYLSVFNSDQLQALAMFCLDLYHNGFMIAQIMYGAWLFPLGYTVYKSGFLPRFIGVVLMIHCCTWLLTFVLFFLAPGFTTHTVISYALGFLAEFGLGLWLVIKGVRDKTSTT